MKIFLHNPRKWLKMRAIPEGDKNQGRLFVFASINHWISAIYSDFHVYTKNMHFFSDALSFENSITIYQPKFEGVRGKIRAFCFFWQFILCLHFKDIFTFAIWGYIDAWMNMQKWPYCPLDIFAHIYPRVQKAWAPICPHEKGLYYI